MNQSGPTADDIASLEYDMVSSALAFLSRSVATFKDRDSDHALAFAIAELATSVEVLMKARLVRHDWMQVCINTAKTTWTFDQLANGSAKTVRPEDATKATCPSEYSWPAEVPYATYWLPPGAWPIVF